MVCYSFFLKQDPSSFGGSMDVNVGALCKEEEAPIFRGFPLARLRFSLSSHFL